VPLIVCGHTPWPVPLSPLGEGQVINVDGRVVILSRA